MFFSLPQTILQEIQSGLQMEKKKLFLHLHSSFIRMQERRRNSKNNTLDLRYTMYILKLRQREYLKLKLKTLPIAQTKLGTQRPWTRI